MKLVSAAQLGRWESKDSRSVGPVRRPVSAALALWGAGCAWLRESQGQATVAEGGPWGGAALCEVSRLGGERQGQCEEDAPRLD